MFGFETIFDQLSADYSGCELDAIELGLKQLAMLQAALDACHARLLTLFDARKGWKPSGAVDQVAWLRQETRLSGRQAAEKARAAELIAAVPKAGDALAEGSITSGHVRVLAHADRRLVMAHADELLASARHLDVDAFQRDVEALDQHESADDGAARFERQYRNRGARSFVDDDGMTRLVAWLDPVSGSVVTNAMEHIADELYARQPQLAAHTRRADALVEMAQRAMAIDSGNARAPGPTIMVLIDQDPLLERLDSAGVATRLADGHPIPAATARRLACEAGLLPAVLGGDSRVLDLGRTRRLVSVAQRQALIVRDGGCVFPGCDRPWQWCEVHHVTPWEHGGRTDLQNLGFLCVRHHHDVHEGGWKLQHLHDDTWESRGPDGTVLRARARAPAAARAG